MLDGLRFLAAISVVAYHFTARDSNAWGAPPAEVFPSLHQWTAVGAFGVDLFFIVSGFVILMSAWGKSLPSFVGSRIGRLYPAYWAAVLATGCLLLVLWPEGRHTTVQQVLVNLTMLQEGFGVPHVDGVYWTLWTELRFYALIGILVMAGMTWGRILFFIYFWPLLALVSNFMGLETLGDVVVADAAPLFAGGMAMYLLTLRPTSVPAWLGLALNILLSARISFDRAASIDAYTGVDLGTTGALLAVLTCFALVALPVLSPLRNVDTALLTKLGLLTYPVYLIHEYWGWWFISRLHAYLPTPITLFAATFGVLVFAYAIHCLVERPLGNRLRRTVTRGLEQVGSLFRRPSIRPVGPDTHTR